MNKINRIHFVFIAIVLVATLLVVRLVFVQIVNGKDYARVADSQYKSNPDELYERGNIYFKSKDGGHISAATIQAGYTIAINPSLIKNEHETFDLLKPYLEIDRETFITRASKKEDPYEEIAHRVSREDVDKILEMDLMGVSAYEEQWRYYPGETLAAQALGFVAFNEDKLEGRYGVERSYEEVLRRGSENLYGNFFAELFSNFRKNLFSRAEAREGDVILTIEPQVQNHIENELDELIEKWDADSAGAIVIDPNTGEIFAMGLAPNFDLNNFKEVEDISVFSNSLVESVFEMGSVVKPLTIAAALDTGAITANTTYYDKGFLEMNEERIENYDGRGRGTVDMQEVLNQSLNTGVVFAMNKMGHDSFREYMIGFGLSDTTGVDLPNEVRGLTGNLMSTRDIEYATASYGQGVAVTPINITRALASLANGGYLIKPRIVDTIDFSFGLEEERETVEQGRVLKQTTSDEITRMLVEVVDSSLRGGTVKLENYSIAAKTGTAQMADPEGGYYEDKFLHSFFGYFPAYEPKFLTFLYLVNPRGVRYSSETLTEPFMDTTKFLLSYYEVPPDR